MSSNKKYQPSKSEQNSYNSFKSSLAHFGQICHYLESLEPNRFVLGWPYQRDRGENRKSCESSKDNFSNKRKRKQKKNKQCKEDPFPPPTSKLIPNQFWAKVTLETKMKISLFSSNSVFVADHDINTVLTIHLASVGQLFRLCPFPPSYPLPACLLARREGDRVGKIESLSAGQTQFSESQNITSQHCFRHKSKT